MESLSNVLEVFKNTAHKRPLNFLTCWENNSDLKKLKLTFFKIILHLSLHVFLVGRE